MSHALDGLIVSNTTLSRDGLKDQRQAKEAGGLSGVPLFERSTAVLARMRKRVGPALPIIGVGGVSSAETALEKIRAGADLVQLYSCMVYEGPGLPGDDRPRTLEAAWTAKRPARSATCVIAGWITGRRGTSDRPAARTSIARKKPRKSRKAFIASQRP